MFRSVAVALALTALVGCTDDPELEPQVCAGDRIVTDDEQLADVASCSEITGDLQISGLDVAAIVLPELTAVGGDLRISRNDQLVEIDVGALASVGGALIVEDNAALPSLDGFGALATVDSDVRVARNDALASTGGLAALEVVGAGLWIRDNAALAELGLAALEVVRFDLDLAGCPKLVDLAGLEHLRAVGNGLWIRNNAGLTSVDGLAGLESIGLDLIVWGNAQLADLDGLGGLAVIGNNLRIEDNEALASVSGLHNLEAIGGDEIIVRGNAALASCDAGELIDTLPAEQGAFVDVSDNGAAADPAACDGPR